MEAQAVAAIILVPFALAFIYAGVYELLRYKSKGRATYGLVYDKQTGTTHVTGIADDQIAHDPEDFDPNDFNNRENREERDEEKS